MSVGVKRASQTPRTTNTVRLRLLMEETQRLEIAARIRKLRTESPFSQQTVADKLGITLRAYQKVEERGTTRWERVEELASIYGVKPAWIWSGNPELPTPDVVGELSASDRIEGKLDELLDRFDLLEAQLRAAGIAQRKPPEAPRSSEAQREAKGR